jgi:hypothetical protein
MLPNSCYATNKKNVATKLKYSENNFPEHITSMIFLTACRDLMKINNLSAF